MPCYFFWQATTVWENWEYFVGPNMNSHNHPALTSIGAWMWRWFAGIRIAEEPGEPGYGGAYAHTTIAPYDRVVTDHARINSVRANLPTTHGDIALAWAFDGTDGTFVLNTTLPVNTAASVTLPSSAGRSWMKIDESGTAIYRSASSGGGGSMVVAGGHGASRGGGGVWGVSLLDEDHVQLSIGSGSFNFVAELGP
jgi:hypothetical protein